MRSRTRAIAASDGPSWQPSPVMRPYEISSTVKQRALKTRGRIGSLDSIDARRSALVVVDMQNHFVGPGFSAAAPAARTVAPAINRMASKMRASGGLVVWIQTSAAQSLREWRNHHEFNMTPEQAKTRLRSLAEDAEGFLLHPDMQVAASDLWVKKTHYSAFIGRSSNLDAALRARGVHTLLISGTVTNVCCESCARDAMMLDYRVAMLSDGCAAWTNEEHVASLDTFVLFFGDVLTVEQAIARIE